MKKRNIILIIADALRIDKLGCYGNKKKLTPNIDKFASEGIVFNRCYSSSTWTFPAMGSLFTSYYPDVHLLKEVIRDSEGMITSDVLGPNFLTLASTLSENGFDSLSVVANPWLRDFFQVTRGFKKKIYEKKVEAERINELFFKNIKGISEPYLCYLHYMDCHAPFNLRIDVEEKYKEIYENLSFPLGYKYFKRNFINLDSKYIDFLNEVYEGEVKYLDSFLGEIFERYKDSIIIFTSDHGEFLGDRKYHSILKDRIIAFGHNKTPYEELIKVPLIIRIPGYKHKIIDDYVHHVDIYPTILELVRIKTDEEIQGKSLIPVIEGEKDKKHFNFAYSIKHENRYFDFIERCITYKDKKLIQFLKPENYSIKPLKSFIFQPINYSFENYYTLLGYSINKNCFNAGESGWIKLYIRCDKKIDIPNVAFMILFTEAKKFEVPFVEVHFPSGGLKRVKDWKEGEIIEDSFSFKIPENAPPGNYYLKLGAYNLNLKNSTRDAEDSFIGGAKIFGKIEIKNEIKANKKLKKTKNLIKKLLFLPIGYPSSWGILGEKKFFKSGEDILIRVRTKSLFNILKHIHFKFFTSKREDNYPPIVFQADKGILNVQKRSKLITNDTTFPISIPPNIKNGFYNIKVAVFPKILRKKKWDFAYFYLDKIKINCKSDFVLNEKIILCGINIKNKIFKVNEKINGEVILKFFSPTNESFKFDISLMDEKGKKVLNKNFETTLNVEDIPYQGYTIDIFPFDFKIPGDLKSGFYTLSFEYKEKNLALYQISLIKEYPKLEVIKEEFYHLKGMYGDKEKINDKISDEEKKLLRELLDEKFKEGFIIRNKKSNLTKKSITLEKEIERELKDLGYL